MSHQGYLSTSPRLLNFTGHYRSLHSYADDAAVADDVADDDVAELWQRGEKLTGKTS